MRTTHTQFLHRMLVLAVGACILTAACGGGDTDKTATPKAGSAAASNAASESAYCGTARQWAIHQLVPPDDSDPAAMRAYWKEYTTFNETAQSQAPSVLRDEWNLNVEAITTQLTPVFEKYDFNIGRLMSEGSDEEKALTDQPPPDVQKAQGAIHNYESKVCAAEQPAAAEVDFSSEKKAEAYCAAVAADNELTGEVQGSGMQPDAVRKLATSKEFATVTAKERDTAPPAIKADAEALYTFVHEQQLPVLEQHGYDMRKILIEGPQHDREALQQTSAEVRNHYARVAAYEEQVCGQ